MALVVMRLLAIPFLTLCAFAAAGCCNGREIRTTGDLEVGVDEACPDPAEAERRFERGQGTVSDSAELVSVDGPATRTEIGSWSECCYGVTLIDQSSAEVCAKFYDDVDLEPAPCPDAATVRDELVHHGYPVHLADQIDTVVSGPTTKSSSPRLADCKYPVTGTTSMDSCG